MGTNERKPLRPNLHFVGDRGAPRLATEIAARAYTRSSAAQSTHCLYLPRYILHVFSASSHLRHETKALQKCNAYSEAPTNFTSN